jgi:hypothetical protein
MPKRNRFTYTALSVFTITFLGCASIHKEPFFDRWDKRCLNLNYHLSEEKKALKGETVVAYGDYSASIGEIISFTATANIEFSGTSIKDRQINPGNIIYKTRKKLIKGMTYPAPYKKKSPHIYFIDIGDVFITTENFNSKNNYLIISEEGSIFSDLMYCSCGADPFQPVGESSCYVVKTDLASHLGKNLFEKKTDTVLLYSHDDTPVLGFKLVYQGKKGENIVLLHKEYVYEEDTHRFRISPGRELVYNLEETDVITFNNYKITVLSSTTDEITYRIDEDKIDRSTYDYVKVTEDFIIPLLTKNRPLF